VNHWIVVPVILPAFTAVFFLLTARADRAMHRAVSVLATLAVLGVAVALLRWVGLGDREVYALGDWPVPFGIVLVLDRLSALMVLLTSVVGLGSLLYAVQGWDTRGRNYHALFQFQLMGLNGAFLTGDLFNLFVFFEVLLIASYGLLLHGGGRARVQAGLHYVIFNLAGSALFVAALGLIYGALGTLNMADLAIRVADVSAADAPLVRSAGLLLLVVFSVKAAALPLYFWLPGAYSAASAPVAALFAIMTKVGIYSILRVYTLVFGPEAGLLADLALPLLIPAGLLTTAAAIVGVLASRELRGLCSYLVIASVGTLLIALGIPGPEALAAALYYLVHSTLVMAGLFLLAEVISQERGAAGDALVPGSPVARPALLGSLFFVAAVAVAGMPPLSGFFGKVLVLKSALASPHVVWIYAVVLGGGLLGLVALSRAGSNLFWKTGGEAPEGTVVPAGAGALLPVALLLALTGALVLAGGPVYDFMERTAAQLMDAGGYVDSVMGTTTGREAD